MLFRCAAPSVCACTTCGASRAGARLALPACRGAKGRGADSKDSKRIVLPRAREHLYMPHCRGGVPRANFYA